MPFLMMLLAAVAGAAFWWGRLKAIGEVASEATDMAGRAWGKYKRMAFALSKASLTTTQKSNIEKLRQRIGLPVE